MLRWQSTPGIRSYARNPQAPDPDQHECWLKAKLADPGCVFNVVLCGDLPVGILRFDWIAARNAFEVSILIDAEHQAKGIASHALELGKRLLPSDRIIAAIHAENHASIRLFEAAGYRPQSQGEWLLEPVRNPSTRQADPGNSGR